jgi:hypothetical protein
MNVLLPDSAKYVLFSDDKKLLHHERDITWSFSFRLNGYVPDSDNLNEYLLSEENQIIETESGSPILLDITSNQFGFCTFLTNNPKIVYLTNEIGNLITDEFGMPIILDFAEHVSSTPTISSSLIGHYMGFFQSLSTLNGDVAIAYDTTGSFALSSTFFPKGVSYNDRKPNSLIIRDVTGVIFNETVDIDLNEENILRFRYINKSEIAVDHKSDYGFYKEIVRIPIKTYFRDDDLTYPSFFYTSPVSSNIDSNLIFYMKNFHVQGNLSI